jgi:DNA (cytosine-5)-methyltransferase 1
MKVLDLFAGAGGFSLGFQLAGHEIIGAIEMDEWAAQTFKHNHQSSKVLVGDITSFSDQDILAEYANDSPDIILGGPPCQGYSVCLKNAGDPKDPRNSLFIEMIRFGKLFSPSLIIMENVPNLLKAKNASREKVIDIIQSELKNIGYYVYYDILEATSFGVPQIRKRLFVIASKKELSNPFPKRTHSTERNLFSQMESLQITPTLWNAISDLPVIDACEGGEEMDYTMPPQNSNPKLPKY